MDLIKREAAIIALSHNKVGDDDVDVVIQHDIETIKALSSAVSRMDLIKREAAIIALSHNKVGDDDADVVVQHDIETIKALSSAQ